LSTLKKAKKWPNGQTILFLANSFIKGQMATLPVSLCVPRTFFAVLKYLIVKLLGAKIIVLNDKISLK